MKALPHKVRLCWVVQLLPVSKKHLYNLKCSKKIDFLVNTDWDGKPTKRLWVDLPKLCAFLRERGLGKVLEQVISTVRVLAQTSEDPDCPS